MEAIPTYELISYTKIRLLTNGFDLCTPKEMMLQLHTHWVYSSYVMSGMYILLSNKG